MTYYTSHTTGSIYEFRCTSDISRYLTKKQLDTLHNDLTHDAFVDDSDPNDSPEQDLRGECWFAVETQNPDRVVAALWIGELYLEPLDLVAMTVYRVFTISSRRRQGIMAALFECAMNNYALLAREGVVNQSRVYLTVWDSNTAAKSLYQKQDFQRLTMFSTCHEKSKSQKLAMLMYHDFYTPCNEE